MFHDSIMPAVVELAHDPVPNIRFNVAKSLEALAPVLLAASDDTREALGEQVKTTLLQLQNDNDVDVKYFAQRALLAGTLYY